MPENIIVSNSCWSDSYLVYQLSDNNSTSHLIIVSLRLQLATIYTTCSSKDYLQIFVRIVYIGGL